MDLNGIVEPKKTREQLYAEDVIRQFVPKDQKDKIVEHIVYHQNFL